MTCRVRKVLLVGLLGMVLLPWRAAGSTASSTGAGDSPPPETLDEFLNLSQPYINNIGPYNPTYFLVGADPAKSKFQISMRYRLFQPPADRLQWLRGINFGYTQTSFWDLRDRSVPFKDTSYMPELFYYTRNMAGNKMLHSTGLFLKGGVRHESNGRDGPASRSTNIIYLQPYIIFLNTAEHFGIRVAPIVWAYVGNDDVTNPDLSDYRGNFKLHLKTGWADGLVLDADLGLARKGASYTLDLTYPLRSRYMRFYFHVSYASVLAESLLSYRNRTDALRLGINFVR